uniref:Uncharacterized protein n=1 Tax=viral metagenome TaxID=1070528 RepID=A0A6C0JER9_9ZZZZ
MSSKEPKLIIKKTKKEKENSKILTKRGYAIVKNSFMLETLLEIKSDLNVKAFVNEDYGPAPKPYPIYLESEKKLFLPKHYGFKKLGEPDLVKLTNGIDIDLEFKGELRDNQKPVIEKFLETCKPGKFTENSRGGIISVGCGFGKTVMALHLISQLAKKTIVIVHKEFLLNQWKKRIQEYLPTARIGIIQAGKINTKNKDIVIAMLQSISMKDYDIESTFGDFGFTIVDECFPFNTGIITDQGIEYIGSLFEKWRNNKNLPNILSFNQSSKCFEYKKMTYSWRKTRKELIKITMSKKIIKCTPEHKILTINGYIEARKLNLGDLIISKYDNNHEDNIVAKSLNDDQLQLVYGSYLGDGSISDTVKNRTRLRIIHSEKQKEYCNWKANMFGINKLNFIKENGYSQKPAYSFSTKIFDLEDNIPKNSKIVPQWLINKIDLRGLAIWYMDDGSNDIQKNGNNNISIHSNNYDFETNQRFIKKFNEYKLYPTLHKTRDKYYYLKFNTQNSNNFLRLISQYIHPNMKYKSSYDIYPKYDWKNSFLDYGTLKVNKLEYIENTGFGRCSQPYVYDIEVEDNHNFIIGTKINKNKQDQYIDGPVVSNCHHISAEVFSRSLPKINSMYSLGLSATPKRPDGLSHVFESFLGPMIYKAENKDNKNVRVNVIYYNDTNPDYNKEELSNFGKMCVPRMINNIVANNSRNMMIKYIMKKLVDEGRQVLVLSDRRDHLTNLYKIAKEFTTVGYYIGGMKQKDLDKSENMRVILGTYPMSSEGLDIPTLDSVIFTTPKSSIEQSIGRITRKVHESIPIAYDIVDNMHIFPRQYNKRETVYKKLKYDVYTLGVHVQENTPESYFEHQIDTGFKKKEFAKKGKKKIVEEVAECLIESDED